MERPVMRTLACLVRLTRNTQPEELSSPLLRNADAVEDLSAVGPIR